MAGPYNKVGFCAPFLVFTLMGMFFSGYYGESDLLSIKKLSGPYGVGCRRFWVNGLYNHVLVYYPIDKSMMEDAYADPSDSFWPYNLFGEPASI